MMDRVKSLLHHAPSLEKLEAALVEAKKVEAALNIKAETIAADAAARMAQRGGLATAGAQKIEGGFWKTVVVDSWRHGGRVVGKVVSYGQDTFLRVNGLADGLKAKEAEAIAKVMTNNKELLKNAPAMVTEAKTAAIATLETSASLGSKLMTWASPVMTAVDGVTGWVTNDQRKIETSNAAALTITAGSLGTAALTTVLVAGGAIVATAAAPIVVAGVALSGLAAWGTSHFVGKRYDERKAQEAVTPPAAPTGQLLADPKLTQAVLQQEARTAEAQAKAQALNAQATNSDKKLAFASVKAIDGLPGNTPLTSRVAGVGAQPLPLG